jgi:hypothetical protein
MCRLLAIVRAVLCGRPYKRSLANVWRLESVNSNIRSVHNRYGDTCNAGGEKKLLKIEMILNVRLVGC